MLISNSSGVQDDLVPLIVALILLALPPKGKDHSFEPAHPVLLRQSQISLNFELFEKIILFINYQSRPLSMMHLYVWCVSVCVCL